MSDTRAFDITLEIAAAPDAVWHALTSAEELVRWFPTEATISGGAGGRWMISWDGNWPWDTAIEIWEPNRRLRLVDRNARPYDADGKAVNASVAPLPIAIDWTIEGRGGSTTLRLVHSGFGRGAEWDDEYDGVSLGWLLELNGLRHYLERHRGRNRRVLWNRTVVSARPAALWPRLAEGIFADHALATAQVARRRGEPYATTLSSGDRIEGTIVAHVPDRALQITIAGWNDALYRLWIDKVGSDAAVNSWLSTYDVPESVLSAFGRTMRADLERLAAGVVA
jgi:uncharacterized protein YndB with AHSA1/START domain